MSLSVSARGVAFDVESEQTSALRAMAAEMVGDADVEGCSSVITSVGDDERDEDEPADRSLSGCVDCRDTPEATDPVPRREAEDVRPAGKPSASVCLPPFEPAAALSAPP